VLGGVEVGSELSLGNAGMQRGRHGELKLAGDNDKRKGEN
jgi:hypothetical protein